MKQPMQTRRGSASRWTAALLLAAALGQAQAEGVQEALARPAVATLQPQKAVLLAGALAGKRLVLVGERGIAAFSDDGRQWHQAQVPVSVTITSVRFADERTGMAVGHGGTVLFTDDGGANWKVRLDGRRAAQLAVGAARAAGDARLLKDAERLVAEGPDKPFLDLVMTDARNAIVVGAYGLAFATADGGATWTPWMGRLDNPKSLHIYSARRSGDVILLAGEQGLVLRSDDGGRTFQRLPTPYPGSYFTAELLPQGGALLAGLRGNVWRAERASGTWTQVAAPMPVSITASVLRPDGAMLLANQAGFVLELRGNQLVPLNPAPLPPINGLVIDSKGSVQALTVQGLLPVLAGTAQGAAK
jgi:photosystem II stability/assembly factor-like uncharacterized protein